jgi:hypothetical protein
MRVAAQHRYGTRSASLVDGLLPEPFEVVDDRPVARLALRFRFSTAPEAEPALDLATVVAAAP